LHTIPNKASIEEIEKILKDIRGIE